MSPLPADVAEGTAAAHHPAAVPADAQSLGDPMSLEYHATCGCGYDLFKQAMHGSCPECGMRVELVLFDAAERAKRIYCGFHHPQLSPLGMLAANTRHTLDAVVFLVCAHQFVLELRRGPRGAPVQPGQGEVTARELCLAVRDFARVEFADKADAQLRAWSLATRQDVGAMIEDLIRYGALKAGAGEAAEQFHSEDCPNPVAGASQG